MAATAAEKPQEPRRDADGEPSGAPAAGLDPGPGSRDGALTPEPTDMPAPVVAVAVAESSSARKLGRLFRLTEVHLWDDFYVKPHDWRATETTGFTGSQTAKTRNKAAKQTDEDHSFVEDMELASLMGSLGLPVSFSTRKEKKKTPAKGKHQGRQAPYEAATPMDDNVRTCTNSEELEHVQESMDCMEQTNSCVSSRAAAGYSEVYHGDVDKTLGEDSVNQCEQNDNMSSPVKSGSPVQENQAADSFMQLNKVMLGQNSVDNESIMSSAELCHEEKSSEREDKISGETPPMSHDNNDPCLAEPSPVNNHVEKSGSDFYYECGDWQVLWDQFYSRYYYYNIQTQESTWDPPQGLEDFVSYCSTYSSQGIDLQYGANASPRDNGETTFDQAGDGSHLDEQRHDLYNEAQSLSDDKESIYPSVIATIDEAQDGENRQNDSSVAEALEVNQEATTTKKKKRVRRSQSSHSCQDLAENISNDIAKYWNQRYSLFSLFDSGIKMDEEGWFSVTPEPIAKHHASRVGAGILIDCFTGVGGNTIQFAAKCNHVVAVDIDPQKIDFAQHNATVYGVNDHIDFIIGDFIRIAPHLKGETVFMSPPWGGPDYAKVDVYDIKTMLKPCDGYHLFKVATAIASRVVMFLPRNSDLDQLADMCLLVDPPWAVEVEKNYLNGKLKAITAYFEEQNSVDDNCIFRGQRR
uniref:Trimethylguanosine synthase n=1 Tax=Hordeum vulgare subsp. vulgare TaxID=112509 RepID=A0A8I6WFF4_HORVV